MSQLRFVRQSLILDDGLRELGKLAARMSDIATGPLSLLMALISSTFEPIIPYENTALNGSFFVRNLSKAWKRTCTHTNYQYG
jgi:hypothetical protein